MNPILSALSKGYSVNQVLKYLTQAFPKIGPKINAAVAAGYTVNQIVNHLSDDVQTQYDSSYRTSNKITGDKRREYDEKVKSLIKTGVGIGAGVLGTLALSNLTSTPSPQQAVRPTAILPPLRQQAAPRQLAAPPAQRGLPAPARAIPAGTAPTPTSPVVPQQPIQQNAPIPTPPSPIAPPPAPKINAQQILSNAGVIGLIDTLGTKNPPNVIAEALKSLNKNAVKNIESAAPGISLENLISEYMQQNPSQEQQVSPPQQPLQKQSPIIQEQEQPIQQQPQPEPIQQKIEPITPIEQTTPTIGNLAILPDGKIGEIEDVRQGIAKINVDGKESNRKLEDLELAPNDLEDATRHIINNIPEKEKSTAFMSAIHVPIPGIDLMLTKFWDGKIAWYLDVPEDLYRSIALGLYEPKGKAKTGIGEYKPGVIDSRGAGFHEQIKINPKYSKENKGKTWGYATDLYNAMQKIQPLLHKISKEKYDEKGNIIQPKTKPRKKST